MPRNVASGVRALGVSLALAAGPACAQDPDAGARLFAANCARCHGMTGKAGASGDIRGTARSALERALNGIEEMPEFDLTADEVAAIHAFLSGASGSAPRAPGSRP